ncbi:MAG: 8-oxo-dGTP diphosphatase MutT [Deltaproteobacteria bacterium]|nr:8-oxo-dGTP diphosphatase MutT [Deltaproteobacteria bacterium]
MPSPPKRLIEVAAAIIKKEGRYLITKRLKKSHLGHFWEFPGGKVERQETPEQCVIRECLEEIDVEVKPTQLFEELTHSYPEVSLKLYFFLCDLVSGTPKTIECADLKWVYPEELKDYPFPEADLEIIQRLESS